VILGAVIIYSGCAVLFGEFLRRKCAPTSAVEAAAAFAIAALWPAFLLFCITDPSE
jgi:hypothetical protein